MSKTIPAIWMAVSLAGLAITACDRRVDPAPVPAAPGSPSVAPGGLAPVAGPPPILDPMARPVGADEVDRALADAQAFNAALVARLADIARSEAAIKALAARTTAAVAGGAGIPESQRSRLSASIQAARTETETLHDTLTTGAAAFRLSSTASVDALETSIARCAQQDELAAYPACAALTTEQAALNRSVAALGRRYDAAETAYRQQRTRLEETSAIIALGSDGAGPR